MVESIPKEWFEELGCAVTVCDRDYRILYMNDRSAEVNAAEGGKALVGRDMMECHPPEAKEKLRAVMASRTPNVYTIEKNGRRKIIFQSHWKRQGRAEGLVEITFELPPEMPHFVRT